MRGKLNIATEEARERERFYINILTAVSRSPEHLRSCIYKNKLKKVFFIAGAAAREGERERQIKDYQLGVASPLAARACACIPAY